MNECHTIFLLDTCVKKGYGNTETRCLEDYRVAFDLVVKNKDIIKLSVDSDKTTRGIYEAIHSSM